MSRNVPATHKVVNSDGLCEHTGSRDSCDEWVRNATYLFGNHGRYTVVPAARD